MASTIKNLGNGQLDSSTTVLYTVPTGMEAVVLNIVLVNTDSSARTVNLYYKRSGGTRRRIVSKDSTLDAGFTLEKTAKVTMQADDTIEGDASAAAVVDYVISGVEKGSITLIPAVIDIDWSEYFRARLVLHTDIPGGGASLGAYPYAPQQLAGGTAAILGESGHPGVVVISSAVGVNSGYSLWAAQFTGLLLSGDEVFEAIFRPESFTNTVHLLGFLDTLDTTTPVDGVFASIAPTTGALSGVTSSNSTTSSTGTTYTLSTGTWYRLRIEIAAGATSARFRLFSELGTELWTDTLGTNIPTATGRETGISLISYVTVGGVQPIMSWDWVLASAEGLQR